MNAPDPSPAPSRRAILEKRLLTAARARLVDERVPDGFARRIQQQLAAPRSGEFLAAWLRGFCQALIPALGCLAVVVGLQPHQSAGLLNEVDAEADAAEITLWEALDANTTEAEL